MSSAKKTASSSSSSSSSSSWLQVTKVLLLCAALWLGYPQPDLQYHQEIAPLAQAYASSESFETPLQGVRVVMTGATSGIGHGLATRLASLGATVIALGRSPQKLEALQQEISSSYGADLLVPIQVQLGDLASVQAASQEIASKFNHIDILFNNAGMHYMTVPDKSTTRPHQTPQGIDLSFGVNYLSHFLLTEKMIPLLSNSTLTPTVVQISSSFHWGVDGSELYVGENNIDNDNNNNKNNNNINMPMAATPGAFTGVFASQKAYANSKLAQIWHARALQRRHSMDKIRIKSICPCFVSTGIAGDWIGMMLTHMAYPHDGYGIKSALHAALDTNTLDDYWTNSKVSQLFEDRGHVLLTSGTLLRDIIAWSYAGVFLTFQKFFSSVRPRKSSPESYQEGNQESLYQWSYKTVEPFL